MRENVQPDFDDEFDRTVAEWRERHRLREDDAVLLLIELFRIHQRHWDQMRHREMPSFEHFRSDLAKLADTAKTFQTDAAALLAALQNQPGMRNTHGISRTAALVAIIATLIAGYLIGRAWP